MTVSTTVALETAGVGLYVPFRGVDRAFGPVGTLDAKATTVGDGSGGNVAISLQMKRLEFGFHPLWVPTMISIEDTLATAENPEVLFRGLGNERLLDQHCENVVMTAALVGARNCGKVEKLGFIIEPDQIGNATGVTCTWATNTNLLLYNLHVYGVVFDGEAMARGKRPGSSVSPLLAGVR